MDYIERMYQDWNRRQPDEIERQYQQWLRQQQQARTAGGAIRQRAQYEATDFAKRHRLPDDEEKAVPVVPHMRRKPDTGN